MKRHEARAKRSRRRAEDQFGARNRPSAAEGGRNEPRARPPEARAGEFGVRNDPPDARTRYGAPSPGRGDAPSPGRGAARTRYPARETVQDGRPAYGAPAPAAEDARAAFGARNTGARNTGARDARTAFGAPGAGAEDARTGFGERDARTGFGAPAGAGDDARTAFGARGEGAGARTRQFVSPFSDEPDARTRDFDARGRGGQRFERFDARSEGGRDRSREFQPRGRRPAKPSRADERSARRRPESRQPTGPQSRRPAGPRPGPKATPRRGRGPADRMSVGAIVLSTAIGLSLLGIAERALLEGGPIGGESGPAGSEQALTPPKQGGTASQAPPSSPRQPGQTGAPAGRNAAPNLAVLSAQVRKLTIDERGAAARQAYGAPPASRPIVDLTRTSADKTWVFGTTALPVPTGSAAAPEVAFYAARWTGEEWQVGLSGGKEFDALLKAVPANVIPAAEVAALRRYGAITAEQATALVNGSRAGDGLVLPWKTGQSWAMTTSDGSARPLGSLAFSGGDGRVLAAGTGRLYRFCSDSTGSAMVMLVHQSGLATTYYRMRNVARVRDGGVVRQGAPLGSTGTDRPCGGAASPRAEVGFGLRRGGGTVPLDGAQIGGWTFRERANPLLGFAERGALQVLPGGLMANLGSLPLDEDDPAVSPSPESPADDGAGSTPAPQAGASQKRSQSGANSQQ